jgi:phenylpyruvate tautomerase PptA (4-oxalocrotonate tautomerase family)
MPIYTCTIAESTFSADTKRTLAGEIARIHSAMNHVPSTYVNVAFHELAADNLYTGGEISIAVTRICEIDVERVLVVIQPSPARFAVEGGRVLPEPGQEQAWLAGS